MKRNLIFLGMMLMCSAAHADMYSALQTVYDTSPVISQQRAAVDAARSDLSLARTQSRPYVGASAGTGFSRTKIGSETFDYEPTQIGIEAQQNIFQGFSIMAQIKAAKSMLAAQEAVLYATQQDVFLSAINAYINVLNAAEVLKLNKNNQRVLQEYYDLCVARESVGTLTKTDVAQASARLAGAKYQLAEATAQYDNSLETFRRIYGTLMDSYDDIDLDKMRHLFPESAASAEEYAIKNHPSIVALNAQETAAKENVTSAYKSILPSVDVRASVLQFEDLPVVDRVRDSRVGVYLKLPLYDRGTAFASADKVRHTVAGIQDQIINARRVVVENLYQAWNTYDAQGVAISAARASIDANQMALDGIREEQQRGRRTVLDVLNAQQELLNSRVSLARAQHNQIAAFFAVLSAVGKLNPDNLGIMVGNRENEK
ncbi:MAG: TolC family outer membrane protein [Alphaproteobacteria bacterium]|nr:TolC family outer membrane protein [Alphaproteobacteria bacterium]